MKKTVLAIMKKAMLAALFLTGGGASFAAQVQVTMQIIKTGNVGDGPTYAPARPWYITQDDYELTLPSFEDDYTLELRDEDDAVVYSTFVPAGTTLVVLPSYLSGSFEIRLVGDTYYYRGYIEL